MALLVTILKYRHFLIILKPSLLYSGRGRQDFAFRARRREVRNRARAETSFGFNPLTASHKFRLLISFKRECAIVSVKDKPFPKNLYNFQSSASVMSRSDECVFYKRNYLYFLPHWAADRPDVFALQCTALAKTPFNFPIHPNPNAFVLIRFLHTTAWLINLCWCIDCTQLI